MKGDAPHLPFCVLDSGIGECYHLQKGVTDVAEQFVTLMADYCEEDQARILAWYNAVREAGFTGMQTHPLPMHISLASFPLEKEAEAVELAKRIAAEHGPVQVDLRHAGILPGGKVLVAAPDLTAGLVALQAACGQKVVHGYPWLPHTTMLIDEPETIGRAVPVLMKHFVPIRARIDRLHLCAFWPTREILRVELTGNK